MEMRPLYVFFPNNVYNVPLLYVILQMQRGLNHVLDVVPTS